MRFLLFHGAIEALNSFTDDIKYQLNNEGHETCVMDLCNPGVNVEECFDKKVHAAICYDGIGMFLKDKFDILNIPVINILVDHPMTFSHLMSAPPKKYIQLSPDYNHVEFAKKYYGIKNTFLLPHMASNVIVLEDNRCEKEIPLLFAGWYRPINEAYAELKESIYLDDMEKLALLETMQYLMTDPSATMEFALEKCLGNMGIIYTYNDRAALLKKGKPVDEFIRMYYRSKVITEIIKAGIPITIIGEGWDKFPPIASKCVSRLDRVKFEETFFFMKRADIILNVMPWFKAGSHERVLNSLVCHSCPLTDESSWLLEHFKPDEDCAYYSLSKITDVPGKIYDLISHPELRENIIRNGRKKVLDNYTSRQIAQQILMRLKECYE